MRTAKYELQRRSYDYPWINIAVFGSLDDAVNHIKTNLAKFNGDSHRIIKSEVVYQDEIVDGQIILDSLCDMP